MGEGSGIVAMGKTISYICRGSILRFFSRFLDGLLLPYEAFRLILNRPQLLLVCLLPWGLSVWISLLFVQKMTFWVQVALKWVVHALGFGVSGVAASVFEWVGVLLGWMGGALILVNLVAFLMIPVADWLSELTEPYVEPRLPQLSIDVSWFSRAHWRRIRMDAVKSLFALLISFLGIGLSTLPVLGFFSPWLLAFALVFQFVSYPQTRRGEALLESCIFLTKNIAMTLGFGLILLFGFSIPFFSALLLPIAVVAGTLFYAKGRTNFEK